MAAERMDGFHEKLQFGEGRTVDRLRRRAPRPGHLGWSRRYLLNFSFSPSRGNGQRRTLGLALQVGDTFLNDGISNGGVNDGLL